MAIISHHSLIKGAASAVTWEPESFRSNNRQPSAGRPAFIRSRTTKALQAPAAQQTARKVAAMNKETVDEAINLYVTERMARGKQKAITHFLACLYMKQQSWEMAESMRRVQGLTRYYIDLTKVIMNPFKGPEVAWLASMVNIAIYAGVLISLEEQRVLGFALLSGTLVNGAYLIRCVARKWCDLHVMLAIYDEIVQIADQELRALA
jgi:hypothetical protein